jgi:hypothetical protein
MPTGQPALGRLNSAADCLNNRPHHSRPNTTQALLPLRPWRGEKEFLITRLSQLIAMGYKSGTSVCLQRDSRGPSKRGKTPGKLELRGLAAAADKIRKIWEREYGRLAGNAETAAEIVPERDP